MELAIQNTLVKELEPTHLEVHNESAMHNEVNVEFCAEQLPSNA